MYPGRRIPTLWRNAQSPSYRLHVGQDGKVFDYVKCGRGVEIEPVNRGWEYPIRTKEDWAQTGQWES
jgi:hypothetical protein